MQKNNFEVTVMINGKPAKEYSHDGKFYIEGRKGTRFSIKMKNNSYSRKLFIPTIDGLSVMNGEEGSFNSSGYIVDSYSSITIEGWRTSDKDIASFYFSSPEGSYRKKMKRGDNLGIIGVAVFEERAVTYHSVIPAINYLWNRGNGEMIFPSQDWSAQGLGNSATDCSCNFVNCSNPTPKQCLGTGWGEQKISEVTTTTFTRQDHPSEVFEIHYNTREGLEKAGINLKKEPLYVTPQAFPGQYCKPPKN